MLPFSVVIKSGVPVHDQVVFAVERAMVSGQLRPGDGFPSVRALSHELRINPNTAHRIVGTLVRDGLLEVRPGTGTVVGRRQAGTAAQKRALLNDEVERLVVEARKLSLQVDDVVEAVRAQWERLDIGSGRSGRYGRSGGAD